MGIRYTHFLNGGKYVRIVDKLVFQGIYGSIFTKISHKLRKIDKNYGVFFEMITNKNVLFFCESIEIGMGNELY